RLIFPMQQSIELVEIEMRSEQILAAEIDDRAMLILAVRAIGFDDAHVRVLNPLAAGGANHAQIHNPSPNPLSRRILVKEFAIRKEKLKFAAIFLSLRETKSATQIQRI